MHFLWSGGDEKEGPGCATAVYPNGAWPPLRANQSPAHSILEGLALGQNLRLPQPQLAGTGAWALL